MYKLTRVLQVFQYSHASLLRSLICISSPISFQRTYYKGAKSNYVYANMGANGRIWGAFTLLIHLKFILNIHLWIFFFDISKNVHFIKKKEILRYSPILCKYWPKIAHKIWMILLICLFVQTYYRLNLFGTFCVDWMNSGSRTTMTLNWTTMTENIGKFTKGMYHLPIALLHYYCLLANIQTTFHSIPYTALPRNTTNGLEIFSDQIFCERINVVIKLETLRCFHWYLWRAFSYLIWIHRFSHEITKMLGISSVFGIIYFLFSDNRLFRWWLYTMFGFTPMELLKIWSRISNHPSIRDIDKKIKPLEFVELHSKIFHFIQCYCQHYCKCENQYKKIIFGFVPNRNKTDKLM